MGMFNIYGEASGDCFLLAGIESRNDPDCDSLALPPLCLLPESQPCLCLHIEHVLSLQSTDNEDVEVDCGDRCALFTYLVVLGLR